MIANSGNMQGGGGGVQAANVTIVNALSGPGGYKAFITLGTDGETINISGFYGAVSVAKNAVAVITYGGLSFVTLEGAVEEIYDLVIEPTSIDSLSGKALKISGDCKIFVAS